VGLAFPSSEKTRSLTLAAMDVVVRSTTRRREEKGMWKPNAARSWPAGENVGRIYEPA